MPDGRAGSRPYQGATATNNAGGLLVFDLPGLQQKAGKNVRLFRNRVMQNSHKNFAAPGNIVAMVPSGTGLMIMATDFVEVFDNDINANQTTNVALVSYLISDKKIKDKSYDPVSEGISIHDNRLSGGGNKPSGTLGVTLAPVLGLPLPDILFDGIVAKDKLVDGELPSELRHSIVNNGDATFANFKADDLTPQNILFGNYKPSRNLGPYVKPRPPIAETKLREHDPPTKIADKAVIAYRSAPQTLSEFGLFQGNGATQQPAEGVMPYSLNTKLFSDYATKYRFMQVPDNSAVTYTKRGSMQFPNGTVIAKTFSYPFDRRDPAAGEQLIETRIELLIDDEWFGYSYRWNDEQTEARLSLGRGELDVSWIHDDGSQRNTRYEIPNPNQCLNCHSQDNNYIPIGPTAMNMNRDFDFAEGRKNQLEYLAAKHGVVGLPELDGRETLPDSDDPNTGTLSERARAWLDVNCAHCHSPRGTARTSGLDLTLNIW